MRLTCEFYLNGRDNGVLVYCDENGRRSDKERLRSSGSRRLSVKWRSVNHHDIDSTFRRFEHAEPSLPFQRAQSFATGVMALCGRRKLTVDEMCEVVFSLALSLGLDEKCAFNLLEEAMTAYETLTVALQRRKAHRASYESEGARQSRWRATRDRLLQLNELVKRRRFLFPKSFELFRIFLRLSLQSEMAQEQEGSFRSDQRMLQARYLKHLIHIGLANTSSLLALAIGCFLYQYRPREIKRLYAQLAESSYEAWGLSELVAEIESEYGSVEGESTAALRQAKSSIRREILERFRHLSEAQFGPTEILDPARIIVALRNGESAAHARLAELVGRYLPEFADISVHDEGIKAKIAFALNQIILNEQLLDERVFARIEKRERGLLFAGYQESAWQNRRILEGLLRDLVSPQALVLGESREQIAPKSEDENRLVRLMDSLCPWGIVCPNKSEDTLRQTALVESVLDQRDEAEADIDHFLIHPSCFRSFVHTHNEYVTSEKTFAVQEPTMSVPRFESNLESDKQAMDGDGRGGTGERSEEMLTAEKKSELRANRKRRNRRRQRFSVKELKVTVDGKEIGELILNQSGSYGSFHHIFEAGHELVQVWGQDEQGPLLLASCLLTPRNQDSSIRLPGGNLTFNVLFDGEYDLTVIFNAREAQSFNESLLWFLERNRKPILAAAAAVLLVTLGVPVVWRVFFSVPGPPVFRSYKDVSLVSPDEGATVRIYQEFRWHTAASASSYILTISDTGTNSDVVKTTVQQNTYILTDKDAAGMISGRTYKWSVSAQVASEELRSTSRTFNFLRPTAQHEFLDFNDANRQATENEVGQAENNGLEIINEKLQRYISGHLDAPTPDMAWALQTQGNVLTLLDRRDAALKSYSKAIDIWEQLGVPDPLLYARCLTNYASATQDVGDLDKSLALYKQALVVLRSRDDEAFLTKRSTCLLNLGVLYRELGLARQAERSYGEALEIDRRLGDLDSVADELTNRGNLIVSEFDDPKQGLPLLQEAAQLQRDAMKKLGRPRPTMADTLDSLAVAYSDLGDQKTALATWESALELDRPRSNISGMLATTNNIANALLDELHDNQGALARYQDALKLISNKPDANPDEVWRTYDGLSRVYQNLGDLQSAERYSLKAIQAIEDVRKTVGERQYRRSFNAFRTGPFYGLALLRVRQLNYEEAFAAIESAKASVLRENLEGASPKPNAVPLTLGGLRQNLGANQMALQYIFGTKDDAGLLMAIDRNEVLFFELPKRNVLDDQIRQAVKSISEGAQTPEARQTIISLTQTIIPPQLWSKLDTEHIRNLIISPDGLLHNLPFEALARSEDGDRLNFIITQFAVSIVPSFRWRERMKQEGGVTPETPDLLVVGNPIIDSGGCRNPSPLIAEILASRSGPDLQPLRFSQQEVNTLLRYATKGSVAMTGSQARLDDFTALQPDRFKVIHFATHAISGGSLENSFLLFGCGQSMDALAGSQVADLKLRKQLVVLSACDTDVGDTLFGEGNDSLASGFLMAGAACVVATRWRVRDDVPVTIMETYYDRLSQGDTADDALRAAKLKYIERDANPANWAAFNSLGYGQLKVPIQVATTTQVRRYVRHHYLGIALITIAFILASWLVIRMRKRR